MEFTTVVNSLLTLSPGPPRLGSSLESSELALSILVAVAEKCATNLHLLSIINPRYLRCGPTVKRVSATMTSVF